MWQVHGTRSLSDVRMRMRRSRRRESCDLYVRRDSMSMTRDTTMDNQSRFFSEISASLESLCTSLAALGTAPKGQGMWRDRYNNISFLRLIFTSSRLRRASLCYRRDRARFPALNARIVTAATCPYVFIGCFRDCCTLKEETPKKKKEIFIQRVPVTTFAYIFANMTCSFARRKKNCFQTKKM